MGLSFIGARPVSVPNPDRGGHGYRKSEESGLSYSRSFAPNPFPDMSLSLQCLHDKETIHRFLAHHPAHYLYLIGDLDDFFWPHTQWFAGEREGKIQALALDAYVAYSDVDGGTTATAAGPLRFAGRGQIAGLRLNAFLPRLGEFDQRVSVSIHNRDYLNNCQIVGLPKGACGSAGESVSVQPLAVDYTLQKGGPDAIGGSIGVLHNLHLGGRHGGVAQFEAIRPGARRAYTVLRANLFAGMALPEEWRLQLLANGQHSNDALVPGEQFGMGGARSVRGKAAAPTGG